MLDALIQSLLDVLGREPNKHERERIEALCAEIAGNAIPTASEAARNARRGYDPLAGVRVPPGASSRLMRQLNVKE